MGGGGETIAMSMGDLTDHQHQQHAFLLSFSFVVPPLSPSLSGSGRLVAPLLLGWGRGRLFEAAPPLPGWGAALGAPGPLVLLPGAPLFGGAAGGGASLPPLLFEVRSQRSCERSLTPLWLKAYFRHSTVCLSLVANKA